MSENYYAVLGVSRHATQDEIKKAYKRLARTNHPDKATTTEEAEAMTYQMARYNEAYSTLRDPDSRAKYDSSSSFEFDFDRFKNAFGEGNTARDFGKEASIKEGAKGRNIHTGCSISFMDSLKGIKVKVEVTRKDKCGVCDGNAYGTTKTCPDCNGACRKSDGTACQNCSSTGVVGDEKCMFCSGKGSVRNTRDIDVEIPAGINDGEKIVLKGQGSAGRNKAPNGNLIIKVTVEKDFTNRFVRIGDDVHTAVKVNIARLALGCTALVDTVTGEVEMEIPAGTQPGSKFKLSKRGVNGSDFYVRVDASYVKANDDTKPHWEALLEASKPKFRKKKEEK